MNISTIFTKAYIASFFTSDFWFGLDYGHTRIIDWGLLVLGLAAFGGAAYFWKLKKQKGNNPHFKELMEKYYNLLLTEGILIVIWFLVRYEYGMYIGSRFAFLLILILGLVWLGFILKYQFRQYGNQITSWKKEQEKLKYLNMGK